MVSSFVLRPAPVGDPATLMRIHTTQRRRPLLQQLLLAPLQRPARPVQHPSPASPPTTSSSPPPSAAPASPSASGDKPPPPTTSTSPSSPWPSAAASSHTEEQAPVIVLGYRLWQRRFAADPAIVGKSVTLSGHPYTVVGVAPPDLPRHRPHPRPPVLGPPRQHRPARPQPPRPQLAASSTGSPSSDASNPASPATRPPPSSAPSPNTSPKAYPETDKNIELPLRASRLPARRATAPPFSSSSPRSRS